MAIVPVEADGIAPDRVYVVGAYGGFEHGKRSFRLRLWLTRLAPSGFAFFHAGRARARCTQPEKRPVAGVAILPYYFDASAFCLVDADMLRVDGFARKFLLWTCGFARYIFRNNANAFMAHTLFLHLNAADCKRACAEGLAPAART